MIIFSYDELMETKGKETVPFCIFIGRQKNATMGDWLIPYLAKFSNYKVALCSKFTANIAIQSQIQVDMLAKAVPTLKHLARLKGGSINLL